MMMSLRRCANNIDVLQLNSKSQVRALGAEKYNCGFKLVLFSQAQVSGLGQEVLLSSELI